jgi:hypothetical protein
MSASDTVDWLFAPTETLRKKSANTEGQGGKRHSPYSTLSPVPPPFLERSDVSINAVKHKLRRIPPTKFPLLMAVEKHSSAG